MTGQEIFLLFLGPALALGSGLIVYFLFGRPHKQPHNY